MRVSAAILLFAFAGGGAFAQADNPAIAFEAASIKPFPEGTLRSMSGCLGGPGSDDPVRIHCEYATLKMFLMRAYEVKSEQISGPGWLDSTYFNADVRLPRGATKAQAALMFRNLLAERFKVELHHENRLLPAYALTVAKGGFKLQESAPSSADAGAADPPPGAKLPMGRDGFQVLRRSSIAAGPIILYRQGRAKLQGSGIRMTALAEALTHQLDRIVTDETALDGKYDITVYWTPGTIEPGGSPHAGTETGPVPEASTPVVDLFGALEQQLGLKLVAKKIPRDVLVIDRAEKVPTEN